MEMWYFHKMLSSGERLLKQLMRLRTSLRIGAFIKLLWEFLKGGSSEEVMTKEIERFVKALQKRVDIDVEYQNEYGSSKEAKGDDKGDI